MSSRHDRIIVAGRIHTMAPAGPAVAEAVHVVDGVVAAVGTREEMRLRRSSTTETIDLGDAALLPGFVEPHTHPDLCAQLYAWVDVSGFTYPDVAGVVAALQSAAARTPDGEWIFAFGLDPMLTRDLGAWDRRRLDAISDRHPMFVMIQSMHTAFVNSRALAIAGIDASTPNPGHGGHFGRDAAGEPTGRLEEQTAMLPFLVHMDAADDHVREHLRAQYGRYRDAGITSIGVAGTFTGAKQLPIFVGVAEDAANPVRTTAYLRHPAGSGLASAPRDGARYRVRGVKLWYDGSPYTGTMLLREPYLDTELCCCTLGIPAGTTGRANFAPEDAADALADLRRGGWQVLTHAQGDRGCAEMLELYARVLAGDSSDHRWRLEHCALVSPEDLQRAAAIGVSPSFHVNHVLHYGPELRDAILGRERAERLMPLASALEAGHRISLHADSPMYPALPLSLVRTAVTRLTRHGDVLGARHAISLDAALRAVTVDAAWHLHDDTGGAIVPGRRADFTVLERDPHAVAPADLDRIAVLGTWLDGEPTGAF